MRLAVSTVGNPKRPLWKSALFIFIALCLGYASRRWAQFLPDIMKKRAGDALWAAFVFGVVGLIRPRWSTTKAVIVALAFCYCIEFSQLFHPDWLDRIRRIQIWSFPLGTFILGTTFFWRDQLAYTIGILCSTPVDSKWMKRKNRAIE